MFYLINCLIGLFTKKVNRRANFDFKPSLFKKVLWVLDNKDKTHPEIDFTYNTLTKEIIEEAINPIIRYIDNRFDCSDFRVLQLIKFYYLAKDLFIKYPELEKTIKRTLLNFKFWIISSGKDSMCYYSENHQICFIACEYLIGTLFPHDVFSIDNKTGLEHQKIAYERFNYWIELKNKYSYSEFYSSNYFPVNLTSLSMIILYSNNQDMIEKSKKQMDIILSFYASTLFSNTFINASGRDYSRNVMNCSYNEPNSMVIIDAVFSDGKVASMTYNSTQYLFASFYLNNNVYKLNENIKNLIYKDEIETKRKFSLNLNKYKEEGLYNNNTKSIMQRLGQGAITNGEIIDLSIDMVRHNKNIFHSDFLGWIRYFYSPLLYRLGLMKKVSNKFNFYNNRMAIEENNVYTYRNKYYKLACSQNYKPSTLGAQRNTIVATLPGGITIYTNHPLRNTNIKDFDYNKTPSYFAGYGFSPSAFANKNVGIVLYDIPNKKPYLMPYKILNFTHAYFPTELFDSYQIEKNYAFAKVKDSYIALIGKNNLYLKDNDPLVFKTTQGMLKDINKSFDLIQDGTNTFWIYELSSSAVETFDKFKERIKSNTIKYENNSLEYKSIDLYQVRFNDKLYINKKEIITNYDYDLGGKYE